MTGLLVASVVLEVLLVGSMLRAWERHRARTRYRSNDGHLPPYARIKRVRRG